MLGSSLASRRQLRVDGVLGAHIGVGDALGVTDEPDCWHVGNLVVNVVCAAEIYRKVAKDETMAFLIVCL